MELWHVWTSLLQAVLSSLSMRLDVSDAVSIILLTLIVRALLMPISLSASLRMETNKRTMQGLKPEIERLRQQHAGDGAALASATMKLYREHGVGLFDRLTVANVATQSLFGIGLFQVLRKATTSSRFLWIANLAKPDLLLTILVAALMLLGMILMPNLSAEPGALIMIGIVVAIATISIFALPSTVGIYWATSNAVTVVQTLALRELLRVKEARSPRDRGNV